MTRQSTFNTAAYGSSGWQSRTANHVEEIGNIWGTCGIENEWHPLRKVILHTPGVELEAALENPDESQMLESLDIEKAREEHAQLVQTYQAAGVQVDFTNPDSTAHPNQMFCADLFAMTPEGAILARPASVVRAGEERQMALCLARNGIPVIRTLTGAATFEGADLIWVDRNHVLIGQGLRSNADAASQISQLLEGMGTKVTAVDMPFGTMHLMGMLRVVDHDLAIAWPRRTPHAAVMALRDAGYTIKFVPEHDEFEHGKAFNFVTLGPRHILMVAGNPMAREFYQSLQINCVETPAEELSKAAGAVGCLTGIVHRSI